MITIPFSEYKFSEEIKTRVSGVNITLEYANLESALFQSSIRARKIIGASTYDALMTEYEKDVKNTALDMLQRALLHVSLHDQQIFLQVRIGNDGITTKKNDDETTIFKYQADELKNSLINTTWFWYNELFTELNSSKQNYPEWHASEEKKTLDALPITSKDFERWVGVESPYFVSNIRWIIQEIYKDQIIPRGITEKTDTLARCMVYLSMATACMRMPYELLPENVRKDIDNEMSKSNKTTSEQLIRDRISKQFSDKADRYLQDLEDTKQPEPTGERRIVSRTPIINEDDKYYMS